MECLTPNPSEIAWADLDREWSQFWESLQAHAHDPAVWYTPERSGQLQSLLQRGQAWLDARPHPHEEQNLYVCHLRRLLPVLQTVQRALVETAERLLQQREHVRLARQWAGSQPRPRRMAGGPALR
jgi:hypothetical protein